MELCISSTQTLPKPFVFQHRTSFFFTSDPSFLRSQRTSICAKGIGFRCIRSPLSVKASNSDETPNQFAREDRDRVTTLGSVTSVEAERPPIETQSPPAEESPVDEQLQQPFQILDSLDVKFDSDTYSILLYGGGAVVTLWLASAIIGSIDAIPVIPKLLEVVGLGYTFWFTTRYLLFKKNRDELGAKIEEIKQEVLGSKEN